MRKAKTVFCMAWILVLLAAVFFLPCQGQAAQPADGMQDQDNFGQGFFRIPSYAYFQAFRMAMPLRAPAAFEKGKWEMGLSATAANDWAFEPNENMIDAEGFEGVLWAAYGFSDRYRLEVAVSEQRIWGGFLDSGIESFHNLFGIGQNDREKYPSRLVNVWTKWNANGPLLYSEDQSRVLYRGAVITLEHLVTRGDDWWPAVSWSLAGSFDLRDPALTHRHAPFDAGFSLGLSKRIYGMYAYFSPAVAWYGADRVQGVRLKTVQLSGQAGVEYPVSPDVSAVFQYLVTEKAATNLPGFPRLSHEVALGVKARVCSWACVEAALMENIITYSNSPDFGLHIGISGGF